MIYTNKKEAKWRCLYYFHESVFYISLSDSIYSKIYRQLHPPQLNYLPPLWFYSWKELTFFSSFLNLPLPSSCFLPLSTLRFSHFIYSPSKMNNKKKWVKTFLLLPPYCRCRCPLHPPRAILQGKHGFWWVSTSGPCFRATGARARCKIELRDSSG